MSRGSETRQRSARVTVRFSPQEVAKVRSLASGSGQSPGALLRTAILGIPAPRRRRQPRADEQAIAKLLGELGRVRAELGKSGSNLNQMAHYLNADRSPGSLANLLQAALEEHDEALRTLLELRGACMTALGLEADHMTDEQVTE